MWKDFLETGTTIALALITLALFATLASKNAQTGTIIQDLASGLGNDIATAQAPVTGANVSPNLSYGNSLGMGFGSGPA